MNFVMNMNKLTNDLETMPFTDDMELSKIESVGIVAFTFKNYSLPSEIKFISYCRED